ncbi:universal stress protein [Natrononativus amylolyticus]
MIAVPEGYWAAFDDPERALLGSVAEAVVTRSPVPVVVVP